MPLKLRNAGSTGAWPEPRSDWQASEDELINTTYKQVFDLEHDLQALTPQRDRAYTLSVRCSSLPNLDPEQNLVRSSFDSRACLRPTRLVTMRPIETRSDSGFAGYEVLQLLGCGSGPQRAHRQTKNQFATQRAEAEAAQ